MALLYYRILQEPPMLYLPRDKRDPQRLFFVSNPYQASTLPPLNASEQKAWDYLSRRSDVYVSKSTPK